MSTPIDERSGMHEAPVFRLKKGGPIPARTQRLVDYGRALFVELSATEPVLSVEVIVRRRGAAPLSYLVLDERPPIKASP